MNFTICVAKTKAHISLAVTCVFVFVYVKSRFSRDTAQLVYGLCIFSIHYKSYSRDKLMTHAEFFAVKFLNFYVTSKIHSVHCPHLANKSFFIIIIVRC